MTFRTELSIPISLFHLSHDHQVMTIGSCFSQHIGQRLQKYKFKCISNPFGTVFNPISIASLLARATQCKLIEAEELLNSQGIWVHQDFHSSLCDSDKQKTVGQINEAIKGAHTWLKSCHFLFITLGTSIAYKSNRNQQVVANCHKLPSRDFEKYNISTEEGADALKMIFEELASINNKIQFVLTVSPVRHIKDGIVENSFSKSRLHGMIENVISNCKQASYFPAYEWVMDDLRDYRYYEKDMIHPDDVAVSYIWQKFEHRYFDQKTKDLCSKIDSIQKAVQHRPFNPSSEDHKKFLLSQIELIHSLQAAYPFLDFGEEVKLLNPETKES